MEYESRGYIKRNKQTIEELRQALQNINDTLNKRHEREDTHNQSGKNHETTTASKSSTN